MNEASMGDAVRVIDGASGIVLACHVGPDGDALGSMLGFAAAVLASGKAAYPSFGQPFVVPDSYRFLPVHLLVAPKSVPEAPEVMICFDAASLDRLGELAGPAGRAAHLIVVDHHASNPGFGHINLIDPRATASAEIAHQLLLALGWPISPVVATCLHTGLVTDSGRFQYSNTKPSTLRLAADLVEAGAHPEVISQHIYEEVPFGFMAVAGAVLSRAVFEPKRSLVWSILFISDLASAHVGQSDVDPLIDLVRLARDADVAVLLKEQSDGDVKASLRSRGATDVGAIATELGGGGHHNASGFTLQASPEEAIEEIRKRLSHG
jgi:phosphoesterase RecJ-like protein